MNDEHQVPGEEEQAARDGRDEDPGEGELPGDEAESTAADDARGIDD